MTFAVSIITVVYLPILALEGTEGKMFKPMAFTVVFALIGALLLTLTLVPALCSLLLSGDTREGRNFVMEFLTRLYRPVLNFALKRRAVIVGSALALLGISGLLFTRLGAEFIPQLDEGAFAMQPTRLRTVGVEESIKLLTAMERKIREVPEVVTTFGRAGTAEVDHDRLRPGDPASVKSPDNSWMARYTEGRDERNAL